MKENRIVIVCILDTVYWDSYVYIIICIIKFIFLYISALIRLSSNIQQDKIALTTKENTLEFVFIISKLSFWTNGCVNVHK